MNSERALLDGVRQVKEDLEAALRRFSLDTRLLHLAEHDVPDAHHRLAHVLKLTEDAAHRTMDLVEACQPLVERTSDAARLMGHSQTEAARSSTLNQMQLDMNAMRSQLSEVLLAQGYQDLSGQIVRGVMRLVRELEAALSGLVCITGGRAAAAEWHGRSAERPAHEAHLGLAGPQIPALRQGNAVAAQGDVDSLLSNLGV